MPSFKDYCTKPAADAGRKLSIDGKHWLLVHGIGSDVHAKAMANFRRLAISKQAELPEDASEEQQIESYNEAQKTVVYSIVSAWSFDEECTPDNVKELCDQSGYLYDAINQFAANLEEYKPEQKKSS